MNAKEKRIYVLILKHLSDVANNQQIDFKEYSTLVREMGFKELAENKLLYQLYNDNVGEDVKWENVDISSSITSTFLQKLITLRDRNGENPGEFFTDPIDNIFSLDTSYSHYGQTGNYVYFDKFGINIQFKDRFSKFLLDLINLDEQDVWTYVAARQNGGHEPDDYFEDLRHVIQNLGSEEIEVLRKIFRLLGKNQILELLSGDHIGYESSEVIVRGLKDLSERLTDDIHNDYVQEVSRQSADSITTAYGEHFEDTGIEYDGDGRVRIEYNKLIEYVKNHPEIQTFADLKGHNLIDYSTNIQDAYYEYDINWHELNTDVFNTLNYFYESMEEDDELIQRVKNISDFEQIMENVGFKFNDRINTYVKTIKNNVMFIIPEKNIDYNQRKVILEMRTASEDINEPASKSYKIPFEEIANHVYTEKLFESILKKIYLNKRKYL